jgi:CRISPR/Cas system-associated exonuclease Cas4 (RecB family)
MNIPEQLEFTTSAILVGEPNIQRVSPPRISQTVEMTPSDLTSLAGCFRFFHWTKILGIAEPGLQASGETPQMRLGSIAHKMLETAVTRPTVETLAAAGLPDLAAVFDGSDWRELASSSPERELPFMMHIGVDGQDCWVRGRMDAAVAPASNDKDAIPRVIDYKYAFWREGGEANYQIQMTTYALALMKALGTDRAAAELWYLKSPMKIVRREYTLVEAEQSLQTLLAKYLIAVEKNQWAPADRSYCDRVECGFRERCWSST